MLPRCALPLAGRGEGEQVFDVQLGQTTSRVGLDKEVGVTKLRLNTPFAQLFELDLDVIVDPGESSLARPREDLGQLQLRPRQDRPAKLQPECRQDAVGVLEPRCSPHDLEGMVQGAKPSGDPLVDLQWKVAGLLDADPSALGLEAEPADDSIDVEEKQRSRLSDGSAIVPAQCPQRLQGFDSARDPLRPVSAFDATSAD